VENVVSPFVQEISNQRVGMVLKQAEQSLLRAKSAALKPVGLKLSQYVALVELERRPGIASATLARFCFVSPQSMMVVLKTMEEQGLIVRLVHPRHPNVLELHITDAGREVLHAALQVLAPIEESVSECFSTEELNTLAALLKRLTAAFDTE
jgi:DNA-binding MarR family transcriptional regulator